MKEEANTKISEDRKKYIDKEILEIIEKAEKSEELKKEDIEKLQVESKEHTDFLNTLGEIDLSADKYRVIVTLGDTELIFDNGEFYIGDTIDIKGKRRKISKKEARDVYIEYYIQHQLNPIIEQRKIEELKKQIAKEVAENQNKKEKVKTKNTIEQIKKKSVQKSESLTEKKKVKSKEENIR